MSREMSPAPWVLNGIYIQAEDQRGVHRNVLTMHRHGSGYYPLDATDQADAQFILDARNSFDSTPTEEEWLLSVGFTWNELGYLSLHGLWFYSMKLHIGNYAAEAGTRGLVRLVFRLFGLALLGEK